MKIYSEISLRNFEFWSGAKETVNYLTLEELDEIESILEHDSLSGMNETELNDFFWFDDDIIAEWLGWPDFETLMKARSGGKWFDTFEEYETNLEEEEEEEEEETGD